MGSARLGSVELGTAGLGWSRFCSFGTDAIGTDSAGLGWARMASVGLGFDHFGPCWEWLYSVGLCSVRLEWAGWGGLAWVGLDSAGMAGLDPAVLGCTRLELAGFDWARLEQTRVGWTWLG